LSENGACNPITYKHRTARRKPGKKKEKESTMNAMVLKRMALKSKDKKGFTLVEVIVVLVIIAILMAIAVPALTGYIAKANDRALEAEGRNIQVALQSIATENSSKAGSPTKWNGAKDTDDISTTNTTKIGAEISTLTGKAYTAGSITGISTDENGALTAFTYTVDNKKVEYTDTDGLKVSPVTGGGGSGQQGEGSA
jgi:type IV pilus assembly protein PilA